MVTTCERRSAFAFAPPDVVTYSCGIVRPPVINVEEPIERVVGRRRGVVDGMSTSADRQSDARAWRRTFGGLRVARGVYRFHTHAEADEWLWRMMARPHQS